MFFNNSIHEALVDSEYKRKGIHLLAWVGNSQVARKNCTLRKQQQRQQEKQQAKMESNTSKVKIVSEKDIRAEIASMQSTLNFSQIKVGPGCSGCYTIVVDSTCGHLYRYRKRCQPKAPVCAGSEILTVYSQEIVLKRTKCGWCGKKDKYHLRSGGVRKNTPERVAAILRLEFDRERWRRQLMEDERAEERRRSRGESEGEKGQVETADEQPASE